MDQPDFRIACEVQWSDDARAVLDAGAARVLDDLRVRRLVAASVFEAGAESGDSIEVSVTFCGEDAIAAANEEHRGVAGATDVLSFPIDGLELPLGPGEPRVLGDLLVCPAYVARQVAEGLTMQGDVELGAAIERCVVHGTLHLCGFDHELGELQATEMFGLEQLVLDRVRGAG